MSENHCTVPDCLPSDASRPTGVTSYAYNGLGDRIQQTTGGNTTSYLQDISAGLSQVLDDGSNTYLNGMGRIAQYDAAGT